MQAGPQGAERGRRFAHTPFDTNYTNTRLAARSSGVPFFDRAQNELLRLAGMIRCAEMRQVIAIATCAEQGVATQ